MARSWMNRYRLDGALLAVTNESAEVLFERDLIGRILTEKQGEIEVRSRWGVWEERAALESSLGARQIVRPDLAGRMSIELGSAELYPGSGSVATVDIDYDPLGLEESLNQHLGRSRQSGPGTSADGRRRGISGGQRRCVQYLPATTSGATTNSSPQSPIASRAHGASPMTIAAA